MKNTIIPLLILAACHAQAQTWTTVTDATTGIQFSMPENLSQFSDPEILTTFYSSYIDSTQAVQVHVFEDASFTSGEPLFNEALLLESGDTLRAIARLIVLASDSEVVEIYDITTDSFDGLHLGIRYYAAPGTDPYYSFIRYYNFDGYFVSFTWTGMQEAVSGGRVESSTGTFFNSIGLSE